MASDDDMMGKPKAPGPGQVEAGDTLYFPDSFLSEANSVSNKSAQDIITAKFHRQVPDGERVQTSWANLEHCSEEEKARYGGVVYQVEELSSHFTGAIDLMNRNIFMKDRSEWEENKFNEASRVYVPEVVTALTSKDLNDLAVLVQIKSNLVDGVCLPPWQAIYPGPLTEFGGPRGGPKQDSHKKIVKIATGVTLNVLNELSPENFRDGVALVVRPADSFDVNASFSPRRGDHDFEVEPIFTQDAWGQALDHLLDDVTLLRGSRSKEKGVYGFGLSDIANNSTSFMLGYLMVAARETCMVKGLGDSILFPIGGESYRLMGDVLQIKDVVATTSWGKEQVITLTLTLDQLKNTPSVRIRNS